MSADALRLFERSRIAEIVPGVTFVNQLCPVPCLRIVPTHELDVFGGVWARCSDVPARRHFDRLATTVRCAVISANRHIAAKVVRQPLP